MRIMFFSSKAYDRDSFSSITRPDGWQLEFQDVQLSCASAALAKDCGVVCAFINDELSAAVLQCLADGGTRLIALRSAGFNHVDLNAAQQLGISVVRVPDYSPHAVAEHAVALIMALNRKTHRAFNRTRDGNFSLQGLIGFDLYQKTVGVVGGGKIGQAFSRIMAGFGCQVRIYDPYPITTLTDIGAKQVSLDTLIESSDIISLHCPLTENSHHLINAQRLAQMKPGAMLINTGRGALVDARALIDALKSGQLGYLGLDVYEEEAGLFFENHSDRPLQDDVLARLLTFPNVILTAHQAFLTQEALAAIAETTLRNISQWAAGTPINLVQAPA